MSGRADTAEYGVQDFRDRPVAGEDVAADQDLEHVSEAIAILLQLRAASAADRNAIT
jgi:hypothetical protein